MKKKFSSFLQKGIVLILCFALVAYSQNYSQKNKEKKMNEKYKKIVIAGGCFWCLEPPYDKIDGVEETVVGYAGGKEKNPTYEEVAYGLTGHTEAMAITYDPKKVTLEKLLTIFWENIDPLEKDGQFCDKGKQYRTAIFFNNSEEEKIALSTKKKAQEKISESGEFVTEITAFTSFYPAEDYHQEYYVKNPYRYKIYRFSCGRDKRLRKLWQ